MRFIALAAALLALSIAAHAAYASQTVGVKITFPPESGLKSIDKAVPIEDCQTAYNCLTRVAQVACRWYHAVGALACANPAIEGNCLVMSINGFGPPGWFGFYANGQLASTGVSCYEPNAGDSIELRYSHDANSEVEATPAPTATAAPTARASTPTPGPSTIVVEFPATGTPTAYASANAPAQTAAPPTGNPATARAVENPVPQSAFLFGIAVGALLAAAWVWTRP
jgi:hypothetical protein